MNAKRPVPVRSYWSARSGDGVSAVIAHYGEPAMTLELIADLRSQTYRGEIEIIVSDDASPIPFPPTEGVMVTRSEVNGGFGTAVNRGSAVASQPWLLILNSDVRVATDFIDEFVSRAQTYQPAACGVRSRGRGGYQPTYRSFPKFRSTAASYIGLLAQVRRRRPDWLPTENSDPELDATGPVDWLVGSVLLLPRTLFETVGGFDERYFMYVEEVDLQYRLRLLGVPSMLIADLEIDHDAGRSSGGVEVSVEMLRSRLIYEEKWFGRTRRQALRGVLAAGIVLDGVADHARRVAGRPTAEPGSERRRLRTLSEASRPRRQPT